MSELHWQKSSFSSGDVQTNCVEIAGGSETCRLRESETPDVVIPARRPALESFLAYLKASRDI